MMRKTKTAARQGAAVTGLEFVLARVFCGCRNAYRRCEELVFFGKDLDPATIGVFNEVQAHGRIVVDDTAHFIMQLARGFHIGDAECEMRVFTAIVVRFGAALVPGKLELEGGCVVRGEDYNPRAVVGGQGGAIRSRRALFRKMRESYRDRARVCSDGHIYL